MKFILFLSLICVLLTICSTDVLEENIENEEEEAKISKFTVYTFYYIISLLPAHISFSCVDSILVLTRGQEIDRHARTSGGHSVINYKRYRSI